MNKKQNRLTKALLETAEGLYKNDLLKADEYEKITIRHLKKEKLMHTPSIKAEEIKLLREKAHLSQAAFASYLNLTVGYVSQLERGIKEPKGAVLVLLNVIKRNGVEVVNGFVNQ